MPSSRPGDGGRICITDWDPLPNVIIPPPESWISEDRARHRPANLTLFRCAFVAPHPNARFRKVIDFDAALRDPSNPTILNPAYAGPDNPHPNLLGYQVMAQAAYSAMIEQKSNQRPIDGYNAERPIAQS